MIRLVATVIIAAALLPASAEAAKMRSSSRSSHAGAETQTANGSSILPMPGIVRSSKPSEAKPEAPRRPPFPTPSVEQPTLLKVTAAEPPKPWCRSEVVVGGFCVLN